MSWVTIASQSKSRDARLLLPLSLAIICLLKAVRMSNKAKRSPWHFADEQVHHDNSLCPQGKKNAQRLDGTGQKPHCQECGTLNNID
jgi:hypothetical protein